MEKQDALPPTGGAEGAACARLRQAVRTLVPTAGETRFGVGLALYLAWVDNMFYGARIVERSWSPFQVLGAGDVLYYVSIVTLLVFLCVLAWRGSAVDRTLYAPRACAAGTAGMVVSTLLILSTVAGGALEAVCIPAAGVLSALASGACLMQWCWLASNLDYRGIVVTGAFGYVLAKVIVVLAQALGYALRLDPALAIAVMTALNCLMATGSGVLFRAGAIRLGMYGGADVGMSGVPGDGACAPAGASSGERGEATTVARMAVSLVIVGFVPVLAREMGLGLVRSFAGTPGLWYVEMHGVSLLVMAAASVLIVASFLSEGARRRLGGCYRIIVLLAFVGTLSMPLPFVFDTADLVMPGIWASSAFNCLHVVMWIVVAAFGRVHRRLSTRYFAVVRIGWALGPLLGEVLGGLLWQSGVFATAGVQVAYVLAVVCTLGVYLMYAYVFPERSLAHALDVMPRRVRRPFQERCRTLAQARGLSEREFEIMMYFAKGRDATYIQQELVLTHSTVSSHRQHIYAKLGVHSQQELLDLLGGAE